MIKLEIKIKEKTVENFDTTTATSLEVVIKETLKKETKGELEAIEVYKKKMGFEGNVLVVNKCKNPKNFEKIQEEALKNNIQVYN